MADRKDCIDEIAKKTWRPREQVDDLLDEIFERAKDYQDDGHGPDEAYAKARDDMFADIAERSALRRRAEIMDTRKEISRHRYYRSTDDAIKALPVSDALARKLASQSPRYALEAKLVGVNLPFFKGRFSVDAQYVALRRRLVGGLAHDLEQDGLLKIFATRSLEDKWTDELFELNKTPSPAYVRAKTSGAAGERDVYELGAKGHGPGNPGVTKDAQALKIAETIQKWQREGMAGLNREGAWVRSYSGYITRTSHDADAIRAAGAEKWIADTMPLLDLRRTFGTSERQRALDALREMWTPMKDGDHFDYGKPVEEPLYPNTAAQASASRELHFKDGASWRAYNEKYGVSNPTMTVVQALSTSARKMALLKEFGTKPREAYDRDKQFIKATIQAESRTNSRKLGELADLQEKTPTPERAAEIATLTAETDAAKDKFTHFASWEQALDNRFAQIDGSSQRPVSRTWSQLAANWMAIQRMAKLGRVAFTHLASLPTKAVEASYWGIPFAERYHSLIRGLTQGAEGSAKREALDATLVAFENRLGHMMAMYDVADAPGGFLAKWETTFFKLTGVSSVIDNQRGDAEAMFASHIGGKRDMTWEDVGRKEQRVLQGFGIGEAEWKALHGVEWSKFGERTYLTPSDALKLSDEQVTAYLKEAKGAELGRREPTSDDIAKGRDDLATTLAAAYSDRAGYAIPMPSARIRAILFGKNFEPGTALNMALRLGLQFKIWPADMITRAWGREMYGRIGDNKYDRIAGLAEMVVGGIIFGVASEALREAIQGKDPIAEIAHSPIAAVMKGGQRSGMGSLVGDFLLGEFDRHGFSAVGSLAGPTFSQIDTVMNLLHAGGRTKDGTLSAAAMRERASDLLRLAHDNTPYMNLWLTSAALDTLVWHRLQEAINPGYLKRREDRLQQQQGVHYWLSPAKTDQWVTGHRPMTAPESNKPLNWNLAQ